MDKTYVFFAIAVAAAAALYFVSQNWKRQLVLRNVKIYGAHILTDGEVKAAANVAGGTRLFKLSLSKISSRVEQNPFVGEAVVVRVLPNDLAITVHERNPIALVAASSAMLSVDGNGVILPVPLERKNSLPLISNVDDQLRVGDTAKGELMLAVQLLADAEKSGSALSSDIAEVRLEDGGLVAYTTALSLPVLLGKSDFKRKLIYFQAFLTQLASGGGSQCEYVDLRYDGEIVLGMKPYGNGAGSADQVSTVRPVADSHGNAN